MTSISPPSTGKARARWLRILPAVFVTYSLAYLDRSNFGFGVAAGMGKALDLSGQRMSLLASVFFLGYLAFQLPGAAIAKRVGISRLVTGLLVCWGACAALTGVIRSFPLLVLDRLLLGVAESLIFPAMLLLLTNWFTRAERSRANTFLIMGNPITVLWMSAATGLLIQAVGWQRTFIFEGIPSILWGICWYKLMSDTPSAADWMSKQEALALQGQIMQERATVAPVDAIRKALLRKDVLILATQYLFWSLGIYGFVLWLPVIMKQGAHLSMSRTGLLAALPYVFAVILMLIVSHVSDRSQRRESLIWPFLLAGTIAMFGSYLFASKSFTASFACLVVGGACMYAPYGPYFAIIPERLPANVTGEVLALINSAGALGGFLGTYFVGLLQSITGSSRASFLLMSVSLLCATTLSVLLPSAPPYQRPQQILKGIV